MNQTFGNCASRLKRLSKTLLVMATGVTLAMACAVVAAQAPSAPSAPMNTVTAQDKRFSDRSASFVSNLQPSLQRSLPAVKDSEFAALTKRMKPGSKALRVGLERELSAHEGAIDLRNLVWVKTVDGRSVAKLKLGSSGAKGLRLKLTNTKDPVAAGLQFRVAGSSAPRLIEGPFLVSDFKSNSIWTAWTQGEDVTLEAILPAGANPFELKLAVSAVAHLDKDLLSPEKLGACHRDVVCEPGAASVVAALTVARYTYQSNGLTYTCTGTLMNDSDPNTHRQHFLTARQCLSTAAEANTVTSFWFDQASSCGGVGLDSRYVQVGGGATISAISTDQEMSLMELRGAAPPTAFLSGWSAATITGSPSMMVMHHPQGGFKKMSSANFNGFAVWAIAGQNTHISTLYTQGSTEGGSVGAAIRTFTGSDWAVRGTLSGGSASCTDFAADDRYGRLDLATAVVNVLASTFGNDILGSISTTATIDSGGTLNSVIGVAGDQDWFRISLTAGTTYSFRMDGSSANAGGGTLTDPFLRLIDSSGQEITIHDDISQTNFNSRIDYIATTTGTYYLSAQASGTNIGTYRLSVISTALPPPPPPNTDISNSTSTTATIAVGGTASSVIDIPGDQDWFRISLNAGTTYTFKLEGSAAGGGTLPTPVLDIKDASGQQLVNNSGIGSPFAQIVHTATYTGTHYLAASAQPVAFGQSATGTYRLSAASTSFTPQTGWWWDVTAGGQGFGIEILNGRLFIGGFLYDNTGNPVWFVSNGLMQSRTQYTGSMTQFYGGQTLTGTFTPPTSSTPHGTVSITFASESTATMQWPGGTRQLSRFPIAGSSVIAPAANMPRTGWYISPSQEGRGWMIEVQGNQIYIAGFMYNSTGYPIWYLTSGTMTNANFYSGVLQTFGFGQTYTSAWRSPGATLTNANAGSVSLNFSTPSTANLTLPNGRIIPLVRFTNF